jgi:hypothetical protein
MTGLGEGGTVSRRRIAVSKPALDVVPPAGFEPELGRQWSSAAARALRASLMRYCDGSAFDVLPQCVCALRTRCTPSPVP